jgi:thiamine-phosphate pyrophosphorylase
VGIGPVFVTGSKSDAGAAIGVARFEALARRCGVPAVAIGGISPANAQQLAAGVASGVAVISALFGARDPASAARSLRRALDASER